MKKKFRLALIIYILAVLAFAGYLLNGYLQAKQARDNLRQLSESMHMAMQTATEPQSSASPTPGESPSADDTPDSPALPKVLPQYASLYTRNPDLAGWLRIDQTAVDYPVMYTPHDPEYYLYHDFDRKDSTHGLPFIDYRSSVFPRSTNILIHGHNMKDGSMFATLARYQSRSFYESHPTIQFDTVYETGEYEIFAAFLSQIYPDDSDEFKYYYFIQADNKAEYDDFVDHVLALSLYDTGIRPQYGDALLTLSTCSYQVKDGRMVVVARKKPKTEHGAISW
jgi:sortase B